MVEFISIAHIIFLLVFDDNLFCVFTVRTRALIHITDIITKPLVEIFEKRLILNKLLAMHLQKQLQELQKMCTG